MRSSTLLSLIAAFGPVAVLSSPRPPPGWEVEIITVTFDTARFAHHPPHIPGATTTAGGPANPGGPPNTSLGAGATGTLTDLSPTITSEPGGDECENKGSSSLSLSGLDTYPTASGSVSAYGAETDLSATSSMTSSMTTLSTSLVAKLRRQVDNSPPTTTTSATDADTSLPAGVTAPDGYAGTGYPSLTSNTGGLPSITPGGVKKVKGSGCSKGPGKSVSKGAKPNTSMGDSALTDAYPGATSLSSSSSMATTSATSSSVAAGM